MGGAGPEAAARVRYRAYHGSDQLVHGTMRHTNGLLRIACEGRGKRDFIVEKYPAPEGTQVTCVPCLAALMESP